ncbi:MAG: zinc-dependent metalloprotease [Planctomycetota bacterium]
MTSCAVDRAVPSVGRWVVSVVLMLGLVGVLPASPAWADKDKPPFPKFEEVVEGMTKTEGMLTFYQHDPEDKAKDHTTLLCQIPASLLDQDILLATSVSRGPLAGFQWRDELVRFKVIGKQVVLTAPPVSVVQGEGNPLGDAIQRTYRERYLMAMPIKTMAKQDPVVDMSQLVFSTVASPPGTGMGPGAINRSLSTLTKVKSFPDNVLIDADLAMPAGNGTFQAVGMSYGFRKLPKNNGYTPRPADERIGYFTTVRQDWTVPPTARETIKRYINRWHLEKQDPSLRLSPPKEPIVFVIEKTVPIQWRRWVRAGVLEWNIAFEEIGIVDAIVVQQQTESNEFADVDPEDARYNFIRWIVTGRGFAMGPSRADPRTGQILDADIIIDDGILRFYAREFDVFGPEALSTVAGPGVVAELSERPKVASMLFGQPIQMHMHSGSGCCSHREHRPRLGGAGAVKPTDGSVYSGVGLELPGPSARDAGTSELAARAAGAGLAQPMDFDHAMHRGCTFASGLQRQMVIGHLALMQAQVAGGIKTPSGKDVPEELIGQVIKDLVSHEVGHTLGLRHNFKASSWLSLDEIKARRDAGEEATSASVMDYNPLLFFAGDKLEDIETFANPTIGPYDYWAIEYGYVIPEGTQDKTLKEIASRSAEKGLAYATDEDLWFMASPDPAVNVWDQGSDPTAYALSRVELSEKLLEDVQDWAIDDDDPRHYLRRVVNTLLFERASGFYYLSRKVGGQAFNRHRPGDPGAKPAFVLVDSEVQRDALKRLSETVFAADFIALPPELLNNLAASRWVFDGGSAFLGGRVDYPIHRVTLSMQGYALMPLMSPMTLQRVYDAELKSESSDKFTAAELLQSLRDALWSELDADGSVQITSTRRNLQRLYLQMMEPYTGAGMSGLMSRLSTATSPDVDQMARLTLRDLSAKIGAVLEGGGEDLDFGTRAHLLESKSQIDRMLEAQYMSF